MRDLEYIYDTYSEYLEGAKHLELFDELNENDKIYYVSKNKGPIKIGYFCKNSRSSIYEEPPTKYVNRC